MKTVVVHFWVIVVLWLVGVFYVSNARSAALFENNDVLEIELIGPVSTLLDGNPEKIQYPFTLKSNGVKHRIDVRLRGRSRLKVCEFPPLKLGFSADSVDGTVFQGQRNLKLVTHCRNQESSEQDLLLEYAAYRILNLFSDVSYRVRLLRLTYSDTDGRLDEKARNRYGFIIESTQGLAARTGATPLELPGFKRSAFESHNTALVYLFQYLIGNTDWSFATAVGDEICCHNVNPYAIDSEVFMVPYDFDLSGLVNARYAKPDPSLSITRVTQRLFRGYCTNENLLKNALLQVIDRQSEIVATLAGIPGISTKEMNTATKYLEKFFDEAKKQEKLMKKFRSRCI